MDGEVSQGCWLRCWCKRENNLLSEDTHRRGTLIQAGRRHGALRRRAIRRSRERVPGTGRSVAGDKVESKTDPEARLFRRPRQTRAFQLSGSCADGERSGLCRARPASQLPMPSASSSGLVGSSVVQRNHAILSSSHVGSRYPVSGREVHRGPAPARHSPHVSEYVKGNVARIASTKRACRPAALDQPAKRS